MSLETDLQNVISSATQLNQTVQGKIDNINTTLNNAVADVDATLDAAVANVNSEVATLLANPTGKRFHIQSMYIPESTIVIQGAGMIGNDYDKSADVDNSVIVAENPHEEWLGFPVAAASIVKNPAQEYCETYGVSPNAAYSPYDNGDSATGNPCYVDLPMFNHGGDLRKVNYANANRVWGDSTSGKRPYLVLRIGVEGSPHRAHRTWVQTNCRKAGAYNGSMWWESASPTVDQQQRFSVNGYSNIKMQNTENCGLNAAEDSIYRHNNIYLAEASGYNLGGTIASNYGSWIALPLWGMWQWETLRIWNWGYGDLAISAAGIAFGDYEPA
jgi:hypothetical protein